MKRGMVDGKMGRSDRVNSCCLLASNTGDETPVFECHHSRSRNERRLVIFVTSLQVFHFPSSIPQDIPVSRGLFDYFPNSKRLCFALASLGRRRRHGHVVEHGRDERNKSERRGRS